MFVGVPLRVRVVLFVTVTVNSSEAPAAPEGRLITSPSCNSVSNEVWKPFSVVVEFVTSPEIVTSLSRKISAEKFASGEPSGSSMNVCLTSLKSCAVTPFVAIVKSVLPESSRISSASVEEVDVTFSPSMKVPTTDVSTTVAPEVADATYPYAPEFTPVIFAPVSTPADGVPDKVIFVNIRMSNRYSLNFVFVSEVEERMSVLVPVFPSKCSIPLTRASPITLPAPDPRALVAASLSSTSRYG